MRRILFSVGIAVALGGSAMADVVHDETVDGDLSDDRLNPTDLGSLGVGVHSVIASSVAGDLEYFTMNIADGLTLDALVLFSYLPDDGRQSFIAVQEGMVFTEPADNPDVTNLLGWTHFGPLAGNVGTDILDDMGMGAGAIGFTPPLPAGDYVYWAQEIGASPATYQLDFIVSPAPGALAVLGLAFVGRRRR